MGYSQKQYDLMEKLSKGLLWTSLSDDELNTLHYLEHEQIARPREDLMCDLWVLGERGQSVLEDYRKMQSAIRMQVKRDYQAAIDKADKEREEQEEKRKEKLRAQQEAAEKKAEKEADRENEHKFQWKLSFVNIILGALVSNLDRIIKFFIDLFS